MNKKVQHKKSIFVAGVLSLSAFAMLGLGAMSLSPSKIYAEESVVTGTTVLTAMKTAAGITAEPGTADYETQHPNITSITFTNSQPGAGYENKTTEVSFDYDNWQIWYDSTNKAISIYKDTTTNGTFSFPADSSHMFENLRSVTTINFGEDLINTTNVTDMNNMFRCDYKDPVNNVWASSLLTTIDVSDFDTSNVTDMSHMFRNCKAMTSIDLSNFNTSKVTNMDHMFHNWQAVTSIDVSSFDTSNVTNMSYLFAQMMNLTSITFGSNFDTSNVTNMSQMFKWDYLLPSLDLSHFDTAKVTTMEEMFFGCTSLTSLNVSSFDTSKVSNMIKMFNSCPVLEQLDISSFDSESLTDYNNIAGMFAGDSALTTIYASDKFDLTNIDVSLGKSWMFESCHSLVGGAGTTWESTTAKKQQTYAHIDEGQTNPGYFTQCDVKFKTTVTGADTTYGARHSGKVKYITDNSDITVTYAVNPHQAINGTQFELDVPNGFTVKSISASVGTCTQMGEGINTYKFVYGDVSGANPAVSALPADTYTTLLTVTYGVDYANIAEATPVVFGLNEIIAVKATGTQSELTEYASAVTVQDEIVKRGTITATITSDQSVVYDGKAITTSDVAFTVKSGDTTITDKTKYGVATATVDDGNPLPTDVGTYIMELSIADGYLYSGTTATPVTFQITPAALTLTASGPNVAYGTALATVKGGFTISATSGWVDSTAFSGTALLTLLDTNYAEDTPAGTQRDITWTITPTETDMAELKNYTVSVVGGSFMVESALISLEDVNFSAISKVYDTQSVTLTLDGTTTNLNVSFKKNGTGDAVESVVNVADSDVNYVAYISAKDNYSIDTAHLNGWIETAQGTGIYIKSASVSITKADLVAGTLDYSTAKSVKGGAITQGNDGTNNFDLASGDTLTYTMNFGTSSVAYDTTDGHTLTAAGSHQIKVTGANFNDFTYEAKTAYAVTYYGNGSTDNNRTTETSVQYDLTISRQATPSDVPASAVYYFDGQALNETPSLKNYTFNGWVDLAGTTAVTTISGTTTVYASWTAKSSIVVTFNYVLDTDTTTVRSAGSDITVYADDQSSDITFPTLTTYTWFVNSGNKYYKETACTTQITNDWTSISGAAGSETSLTIYGYQKFAMGLGDINGNGTITTDDLAIYRQQIVKGYGLKEVADGTESASLNAEFTTSSADGFAQDVTKDFLFRNADVNVQSNGSFGDGHYDVRDVCTIAMAIADGYGLTISNNEYNNKEITTLAANTLSKSRLQTYLTTTHNDTTSIVFATSTSGIPASVLQTTATGLVNGNANDKVVAYFDDTTKTTYVVNKNAGEKVYAPADCSNMFNTNIGNKLTTIDCSGLDTSNTTNMSNMFHVTIAKPYVYLTSIDVRNLDTSNVTDMSCMFNNYRGTTLDVSNLNTSKVTNMEQMFGSCQEVSTLNVSNFDTSNVTNMTNMFGNCTKITSLDVSHFNTSKVTTMEGMFNYCRLLPTLDVSHFDTSNVTNMQTMFYSDNALTTLDVSNFDTSNVTDMYFMFFGCKELTTLDISNWNTSNVTNMGYMFILCSKLTTLDVSNFDTSNVTNMQDMFDGCSGLTSLNLSSFNTSNVTNMSSMFANCSGLTSLNLSSFDTSNIICDEENDGEVSYMFSDCVALKNIYVSDKFVIDDSIYEYGYDYNMFYGCSNLPNFDEDYTDSTNANTSATGYLTDIASVSVLSKSNLQTALTETYPSATKVVVGTDGIIPAQSATISAPIYLGTSGTNTDKIVGYYDSSNTTLYVKNILGGNTYAPVDCSRMFYGMTTLKSIDLTGLDTSKTTSMSEMFYSSGHGSGATLVYMDLESITFGDKFDTSNVTTMYSMFEKCSHLTSLDLSGFNTANVTNMALMFNSCSSLTSLDLSNFDTSKVTTMYSMFSGCSSLTSLTLDSFNTSEVTNMVYMFNGCSSLTSVNLIGFNTSKVEDMSYMFNNCSGLTSLDLSGFNTANVTTMHSMFVRCSSLTSLDLSSFNTSNVTTMENMFAYCSSLTSITYGNNWNTSKVTSMKSMFRSCSSFTSIDLSKFDTSKVENFNAMFNRCSGVTSFDLSNFSTESATNLQSIFYGCSSITSLDLSNFNTSKTTNMQYMFEFSTNLQSINFGDNFDTSNVTNMQYMFGDCQSLTTLNLSNFDTSKVTNMNSMFASCKSLTTLDLSSFDTSKVTNMNNMFGFWVDDGLNTDFGCTSLTTVYVSEDFVTTAQGLTSTDMFKGCTHIVGGNGTTYDSNHIDGTYAVIDSDSARGYFTEADQPV